MRKNIFAIIILIFVFFICGKSLAADETIQLRVGGSGQNSWAYSCMVGIAESIRQADPGMELIIQATPGSASHYSLFETKDLDAGNGYTPTDYWATIGQGPLYDKPYKGVFYTIAPISFSKTQVMVAANSDIKSMKDLKGKRVYLGDQGSSSTHMSANIIKVLGIECETIQTDRAEGYEMVRNGRADALIHNSGTPYANILELGTAIELRCIPFTDEEIKICIESGPYSFQSEISAADYSFVKEPVKTLAQGSNIIVRADLDEAIVYRLTKNIVEVWDEVTKIVPAAGLIKPLENILTNSVAPIHPGALKYYEERGVEIPDHLKP